MSQHHQHHQHHRNKSISDLDHAGLGSLLNLASQAMIGFPSDWSDTFMTSVKSSDKTYPPYNLVEENPQRFRIDIAAAGFSQDELNVEVKKDVLTISGKKTYDNDGGQIDPTYSADVYHHRGISSRRFERTFMLSKDSEVVDRAVYENGILSVWITKVTPPEDEPKRIAIQ